MNTINIKKGDTAVVISGKEKGKQAKVLRVEPAKNKVVLEGTNMLTKHKKPKNQTTPGGIIKQEGSLDASNVMVVCPKCSKACLLYTSEPYRYTFPFASSVRAGLSFVFSMGSILSVF